MNELLQNTNLFDYLIMTGHTTQRIALNNLLFDEDGASHSRFNNKAKIGDMSDDGSKNNNEYVLYFEFNNTRHYIKRNLNTQRVNSTFITELIPFNQL